GIAIERIAKASSTGGRHDDDVVPHERERAHLPRQRRRLDVGPGAPDVEPIRRTTVAATDTIGTQQTLLGEDGELGGRRQHADLADQSQPTAVVAGPTGVGPQLATLHPQWILLLHGFHRLDGRDVALGERAHGVVAVAAVPAAGAAGGVLVENEVGPSDVTMIAAALEIAGDLAGDRLRERAHHGRLPAVLPLYPPATP